MNIVLNKNKIITASEEKIKNKIFEGIIIPIIEIKSLLV
ncbi:hypothetical protein SXYLSMQ121_0869 [Staphylococcus xylosus]|nr:hypothetical protein SXYLSMQ121_0869 [Staphylococcus xylosus]